jgi:ribose transport system ATP-binding protein
LNVSAVDFAAGSDQTLPVADARAASAAVALRATDILKRFPGVVALKNVSFEARAGEIHALVGENGAGKSTLMGVVAGDLTPDGGSLEIGGRRIESFSPVVSRDSGIAIVHQHPALLPDLTVAENILLALPPGKRPAAGETGRWIAEKLAFWESDIDPTLRMEDISLAQQHLIEIVKALALEPKVLILDEPTEHMDATEVERLFSRIRRLAGENRTVIYISHRIHEVKAIADRVTVLRDGEARGTFDGRSVSEADIINLIVGRALTTAFPPKPQAIARTGMPILAVENLCGAAFRGVSLKAYAGEIIGLAGIEGNGQRDFLRALAGLNANSGAVSIKGKPVSLADTSAASDAGVAYIPRERHKEALMLPLSVGDNMGLTALARFAVSGLMRRKAERTAISAEVDALSIKTPTIDTPVRSLSGGNQQKTVIARALLGEPDVLLADEPSQGVDAGARLEIYKILRKAANDGMAVIVASSDTLELQGLCDRVLIFSRGQVIEEIEGEAVTEHNITRAALTSTTLRTQASRVARESSFERFRKGDYAPSFVLVAALLILGGYATFSNPSYLTGANFGNVLTLFTALAFIAMGQLIVLLTGGIDLSVGPLTGFVVVVASFYVLDDVSTGGIVFGLLLSLAVALFVGFLNAFLIRVAMITAVIATLATYMGIRGTALLLREIPDGLINSNVTDIISTRIGFVPVAFLVAVVLAIAMEIIVRRTRWGLSLRAVGSNEANARKVGVPIEFTIFSAYVACAFFTWLGGVMLMAQIGVGDPTAGVTYTLMSITAVVLGGASLFGGRGSFIGALLGAALIQQAFNVTTFLRLTPAWQYWLLGLLTIVAATLYSRLRQRSS